MGGKEIKGWKRRKQQRINKWKENISKDRKKQEAKR
jgi:hypothetical protein